MGDIREMFCVKGSAKSAKIAIKSALFSVTQLNRIELNKGRQ
jgi:hypothetical protein